MSTEVKERPPGHEDKHPETGPLVTINIDSTDRQIHRGHQTVAAIKDVGKVPPAYDLDQIVDGKPVPLPDNGGVTIKGGEKFISHPKANSSS